MQLVAVLLVLLPAVVSAFYIPGLDVQEHANEAGITIDVNSLRSESTLIPRTYYSLPFCQPAVMKAKPESLGEILWGDDIRNSPYIVKMRVNESCKILSCPKENQEEVKKRVDELEKYIEQNYRVGMSIENLPGYNNDSIPGDGACSVTAEQTTFGMRGYALGVPKWCTGKTLLNNHLEFVFFFHTQRSGNYSVVGFIIRPHSVAHAADGQSCNEIFNLQTTKALSTESIREGQPVYWTYSVTWYDAPDIVWATRWDKYLASSDADSNAKVHWWHIIVGMIMALLLGGITAMNLLRALHRDFNRYNSEDPEINQEEIGWKLVHADVFRAPPRAQLLSVVVGTGAQLGLMATGSLFFACLGFLSPSNRGTLLTTMIILFVLLAFVAGYICARLLVFFDMKEWKTVFVCALFFPGFVVVTFILVNIIDWSQGAADAVDPLTHLTIFGLWLIISVPLTVMGAVFAFSHEKITVPVNVGKLAREVPDAPCWIRFHVTSAIAPAMPFAVLFLELKFILSSLWHGYVYYVFGFLGLVFLIWSVTVVLVTLAVLYLHLTFEDYRWWWRSFITPACLGLHFFLYIMYYFTTLQITTRTGTFLYFGYMGLVSLAYGAVAGSLGFIASFLFIRKIYGSIKID